LESVEPADFWLADLDPEGHFVCVDAAYLPMLRTKRTNPLGKHWQATVHAGDHDVVEGAYSLAGVSAGQY
jgi:hypothetical protein